MATQVEVSSALTSLTNITELRSEATLQHAFVSSLSDTSNKPGEHPGSLSPLILEKSKFGSPVRPATMPPAASRPRLTPKPFSREKSSDAFAMVKPPVTALKPGNVSPKLSTFAKTFGDMTTAKGLTGNVPPLVDQKLIENKSTRELVANMPFYSTPLSNTVILFNTGSTEKARMKLTPEKTLSTLQTQEEQLPSSVLEMSYRRPECAGIHRQLSLSSESRPVSWNPRRSLERKDTFPATEERAKDVEKEPSNSSVGSVGEVQPRPKQRPVSAIFLESLKDPKQCSPDISDEKSIPEKSWVRKPRPLSMDLTAKFENRDLSVQRKSCPSESKERSLVSHFADAVSSRPAEMGARSEVAGLSTADSSKSNLKSAVEVADSQCAKSKTTTQTQKPSPNEVAPLCWNTLKDVGQVSAKDRKYLWELRHKSQDEQNEGEMDIAATSEKSKESSNSKGQSVKERTVLNQKDTCTVSENSTNASEVENKSLRRGSVKKPVNFQDALADSTAPVNAESIPESPGKEKRIMNIQQRIKELIAENTDTKPGNHRQSFRSRPLSADLTKLFSSPMTAGEMKSERQLEANRKFLSETQGIQENETQPLHETDSRETHVAGAPRKPQQLIRTAHMGGHLEGEGKERHSVAPQGESPAWVASHDTRTHPIPPTAEIAACIKTVRATMFEHNVQRHNIAADHFGAEPAFQPVKELVGRQLGHCRESWMERELETKTASKKVPSRQADISLDAEKLWKTESLNEDKALQATTWGKYTAKEKYEKPTPKHVEDSLMYQRIEPRYEILQTVGERVQSEAVAAVPEDKAVTLRSRRSLKERRKTDGSATDAAWPRSLDIKGGSWKEDGFISKPKAMGEAATKTTSLKELSLSQHVFHEQVTDLDKTRAGQLHTPVKPPYLTNRNKDSGIAVDKVSKLTSEAEKEKSEAVLAGKLESSKMLKRFSENSGAGPGRTDGCEARVNVGQNTASSVTSEHESQPLLHGASQWQKFSSRASQPCTDPKRTYEQEGSKVFGLRTCPAASGAQEELNVSDRRAEGGQFQQLDEEERVRRSGRNVPAAKASERWRRKTLPHDSARFEDVMESAQENAKSLSRRDSLQLRGSSAAKRSPKLRNAAEPRDGSFKGTPSSPDNCLKNQLSPSEPKATYFAVTYQIPDENENISGNVSEPLKSRLISSLAEDASVTSREPHPSNRQHSKRFSDTQGSLDRHLGKNGGAGDGSDLPRQGTFKYPLTEVRDETRRSLERRLDDANGRVTDVGPLLRSELKSHSFRHIQQDSECSEQKKHSGHSHGMAKDKAADNYRSRVLDIDVLMAEYEEDSKKASLIQDKREGRLPEDNSLAPWEKLAYKRTSTDKMSCDYNQRDSKRLDRSSGSSRQGVCAAENVCVDVREKLESCSQEPSPLKTRDVNFSPAHWGRPSVGQAKHLPPDPAGNRKKTFIIDEGEGESLVLRHQSEKYASYKAQVSSPVGMAVEPEASFAPPPPPPSQLHADGALWKGMSPKQQTAAYSEDDWCTNLTLSGINKRKASANGSSLGNESSTVESGAEWNSATSGLANALPDFRCSYSEKARQARVRDSLPSGLEAKQRQDQNRVRQSFPPETAEIQLSRQSTSQYDSFLQKGEKDSEREWTKQDCDGSGARNSPYLPIHRRSRSFYKDKRKDHWTVDQLKQCFGRPAAEAQDTDTLVQEADSQYGTWSDQRHSGDSFVPESPSSESNVAPTRRQPTGSRLSSFSSQTDGASATDQQDSSRDQRSTSLDRSSTDVDSADSVPTPVGASVDFSFLEQTPVLDSSALKTRVQLSKRRRQHRAPISHSLRRSTGRDDEQQLSVAEEAGGAWTFRDSAGEKSAKREDSDEEESPRPTERSPASQLQRRPMFPGMDHSALKAQLRKRHEPEGAGEGHPVQLPKSPRSPFQAGVVPGGRGLPAGSEKEERSEEPSPQWLKELKSKKRQSQYENQV